MAFATEGSHLAPVVNFQLPNPGINPDPVVARFAIVRASGEPGVAKPCKRPASKSLLQLGKSSGFL